MQPFRPLVVALALASAIPGQDRPADARAEARAALDRWLASDLTDADLQSAAADAIVAGGSDAIADLGARVAAARAEGADRRLASALGSTVTHVAIAFLKRESESGMVYEGQYAALRPLLPEVGRLYLTLLIDTPDWFNGAERHLLVAPLRDLYPDAPGADASKQVQEIARDEDFEPQLLRDNLAFLLAQWGDRELIDARLARLRRELAADPPPDAEREAALRYEIADVHYTLREYRRAAEIHVAMLRAAEKAGAPLLPVNYYNAACSLSRAGAVDDALAELERAARRMREGVDPSQRLERKLFDRDPDLEAVRRHPRFAEIVDIAFGR